MTRRYLSALTLGLLFCCAAPAVAQITVPAVTTNFQFDMPFALTVAHPCRAGFVLIKGTTAVTLTTTKATDFKVALTASASGSGEDATSTGALLATGLAPYDYASNARIRARFPNGTPLIFGHSLTVIGELIRSGEDAFTIVTTFDLDYANGIPAAPKLKSIDVSCN